MGPCLFLSKWFDMFCSCSIVSYDISKLRVTSLFCFWIIHEQKSNTIELEWGGLKKKVELQNIAFFHLMKFCEEQGSIKSPLATVSMNNAPQGWKTLGDLLYLCRLLTLLPLFFPLLSPQVKKDPLSAVSLTVHASIAWGQNGPNLHRSVLGPIIIIPNVLETQ